MPFLSQEQNQPDIGEIALAVFGAHRLLEPTDTKHTRFGIEKLREIGNWEDQIQKRAKVILTPTDETPEYEQPKSYSQLLDRLSQPLDPQQLSDLTHLFPRQATDIIGPFNAAVTRLWDYLRSIFPTQEYQSFAGPTTMVPDDDAVWSFFSSLWPLQDPLVVFDLIAIGAMLDTQTVAVRTVYPTLSRAFDDAIYAVVGEAKANKQSFQLPVSSEDGLAVWMSRELSVTDKTDTEQNKTDPAQAPAQPAQSGNNLQTPNQKALNP